MRHIVWLISGIILLGPPSQARVFNMNEETLATSVGGSWGPSAVLQTHFEGTSGDSVYIADAVNNNLSGEVGLVFTGTRAAFRLGIETIHPYALENKEGRSAADQLLYTFSSDISVLLQKADIDFVLRSGPTWKIFLTLGGGVGTLSYRNSYVLAPAGQTAFVGVADFTEEGTSSATMMEGGFGYERLFTDTTTMVILLGYRQVNFTALKFKTAATTFTGTYAKGDAILNSDGANKTVDFTGVSGAIYFRFYLGK